MKLQPTIIGNIKKIISDNKTQFNAKDFNENCAEKGIKHIKITIRIPKETGKIK